MGSAFTCKQSLMLYLELYVECQFSTLTKWEYKYILVLPVSERWKLTFLSVSERWTRSFFLIRGVKPSFLLMQSTHAAHRGSFPSSTAPDLRFSYLFVWDVWYKLIILFAYVLFCIYHSCVIRTNHIQLFSKRHYTRTHSAQEQRRKPSKHDICRCV